MAGVRALTAAIFIARAAKRHKEQRTEDGRRITEYQGVRVSEKNIEHRMQNKECRMKNRGRKKDAGKMPATRKAADRGRGKGYNHNYVDV